MTGDTTLLAITAGAMVGVGLFAAVNEYRKIWIRRRTYQVGWHVVKPVRKLGPDYGDGGSWEWHYRCKYCGEEHPTKERFSDDCALGNPDD